MPDQVDVGELQALGGVEGHEGDLVAAGLGRLGRLVPAGEGQLLEEAVEASARSPAPRSSRRS